ncbi:ATP-binding protein [Streptomyces griseoviridis]|uniref:ATP-binding protein n=1 Tax=Streptomyces griseoviridis TaxID=45398 RepID=UPI0033DC685D
MTIHLADQERDCRRAPAATADLRSRGSVQASLDVSIERRPDPNHDGLSRADAVWPKRLRRILRARLTHWGRPDLIEAAELLLTELTTNALHHGRGPVIGVRVYVDADHLRIKVNDGDSSCGPVLHRGRLSDETGRGLYLVDAVASAWGVSEDRTETWCTLPLAGGPPAIRPAAVTALVRREVPLVLPADRSAAAVARIQARTLLTALAWPGDRHYAVDVLHALVDNAVQHALTETAGQRFSARLSVTEANELLIDVTDPVPGFPDFDKAVAGERGRDLWRMVRQGAALSWFVVGPGFSAKTVRAVLRPGGTTL